MSQALKERLKNLITFILIITGIIQVGILFGYQNEGTPTNLFLGLFNRTPEITDDVARGNIFFPDRLILSDGEKSYWVMGKNSAGYNNIWEEGKKDLHYIADGTVKLKASDENWGDLTVKKGVIIDFGYIVKPDLLRWFLGNPASGNVLPDFQKLMIKPDIVDNSTGLIYIYASNGRVYVSDSVIFEKPTDIDKAFESAKSSNSRVYSTFRGDNIDVSMNNSSPDVLYVNKNSRYWPYYGYNCKIPARVQNKDDLVTVLLGNDKGRYDLSTGTDDTIQFSDSNNSYRLYSDGYLTYQYLDTAGSSEKGSVGAALLNAYKFFARVRQLSDSAAYMKLSAIDEIHPGVYSISFDYILDNMPVRIDMDTQAAANADSGRLVHAVNIQADSTRVLQCVWLLRDFTQAGRQNYNDRLTELMSLTGGRAFDELQINDLHAGYFIKSAQDHTLKPNLLIELNDKSGIQVEMQAEKGD